MLKQLYQFLVKELAGLESELFRESRYHGDVLKLKDKKAFRELAQALAFLTAGIKYIFFQFLLALVELAILIVLPPKEGYELLLGSWASKEAQLPSVYEVYEKKHKKARWVSLGTFSAAVAAVVAVSLVVNLILPLTPSVLGATYTFSQTNWGGGSSSNNAIHPTNQSGWSQYSSASSEITAVNGGEDLELVSHSASSTQTTDAQFNAGAFSNATTTGSGASASVKLTKALHINEYTIGASTTVASITASSVTLNSNGTWTIAFSGTPNLARLFKNDKFTDSASKAWKVLSVAPSVYKIIVVDSEGNTPAVSAPATGAGTAGRWYASISAWEAGRQGDITATGRNAIERGLPYYDGAPDTTAVTIDGWTTDATHYIEIYVPLSERHRGKWDTGKYRLSVSSQAIWTYEENTRIDGLQVEFTSTTTGNSSSIATAGTGISDFRVSNTIIKGTGTTMGTDNHAIYLYNGGAGSVARLWNNILYDFAGAGNSGIKYGSANFISYTYNNTIFNSTYGYYRSSGTVVIAKNNISYNNADNYYGTFDAASTNNLSGNNQNDAPGTNPINLNATTTVPFVDPSSGDFHLEFRDGTGNPAMNAGTDLSADANLPFNTDIDGDARSGTWDIGADDVGAALVMTHSIGTASRDFATLQEWENTRNGILTTRQVYKISGQSGAFQNTEQIMLNTDSCVSPTGPRGGYIPERGTPTASEIYLTLNNPQNGSFAVNDTIKGCNNLYTATISAVLTTAGTIEKGEAYKDSTFTAGVTIDNSTTDATHYMWLTAEPGSRHTGVAGTGTKIYTAGSFTVGANVLDDYSVIEWLEISHALNNFTGIRLSDGAGNNSTIRNNLVYGPNTGDNSLGIDLRADYFAGQKIYNNTIYGFNYGIKQSGRWNAMYQYNNVIFNNITGFLNSDDQGVGGTNFPLLRNNISVGNTTDYAVANGGGWSSSSSNNISSDATAPGTGSLTSKTVSDLRFVSTASDFIDLHIMDGSVAKDAGADLSATFTNDVDGSSRQGGTWDVGADEWFSSSPVYNSSGTFTSGTIDLGSSPNFTTANFTQTISGGAIGKSWGGDNYGQLGDDATLADKSTPVSVSGITNAVAIAAGGGLSLALLSDGTIKSWGRDYRGQLGDDATLADKSTPVSVSGITNAVAIAAGGRHSLALLSDGTIKSWGSDFTDYDGSGQLGDDAVYANKPTPVSVSGITNAVAIAAGADYSLALLSDGTIKSWGYDGSGQLGDDAAIANKSTPVSVSGITNAVAIAAGGEHSLALLSDGTIKAWGRDGYGQLGDDATLANKPTPVLVSGITNAVAIAAGGYHSLALLSDGTIKSWGLDDEGQLGDGGADADQSTPVSVSGIANAVAIAAGGRHSLALLSDGTMKSWGFDYSGQLGNGGTFKQSTPVSVSSITNAVAIAAGGNHSLAITGGVRFQVAANTDNATWNYLPLPRQVGVASNRLVIPPTLDSSRYLRYKAYLSTADSAFSPQLDDLTVNYSYYATSSPYLTSSPYNSNDATNILGKIAWTATTTSGTEVRMQVRSAPNSGGVPGAWSLWCGYTACDDADYFATSTSGADLASGHPLKNGGNDQWLQYKAIFISNGAVTPTFHDVTMTYVVNAPPVLQNVTASQQTSDGKVAISYEVKDVDTATGTVTPNAITPSFSYSLDGGQNWTAITSGYLSAGALTNKTVNGSTFTQYSTTWDAKTQLNGTYATNTKIMVTATDNEGANNTVSVATSVFTLDVKNPVATVTVDGTKDGQAGAITTGITDNSSAQMMLSNRSDYAADGLNGSSGQWIATSTSLTWTFASGDPVRVYAKVKDAYQNEVAVAPDAPNTPANATIQDTSSLNLSEFREFVSWSVNAAGDFGSYKIYRSTNSTTYNLLSTITSAATNYLEDGSSAAWLSNGTTYYYKVVALDSSGNISRYSSVVSDIPDGQGGTDVTPPTISGLGSSNINTTQATITWTTDELSNSAVYYSTNTSYNSSTTVASMVTVHSVTLTGLSPNTAYNFRVRSTDPLGNISSYATGTPFTTAQGPVISGVTAVSVSGNSATIVWNTNANSDSWVIYSANSDLSGAQTTGTSTLVGGAGPTYEHRISLSGLNTNAKYYFKVRSVDGSSNAAEDNNGGAYYTFSTAQDVTPPVISNVVAALASQTSAVISWTTNELSDSQVIYGLDQSNLTSQTSVNSTMTINHSMVLSGLTAGATYYYKVVSADSSANSTQSSVYNFNTTALALQQAQETLVVTRYVESGPPVVIDKTSPLITEVKVDGITESEATVTWRTDEEADSFVEYGPPDILGFTHGQRESVKLHRVVLMDLKPNARYSFKATSADTSGNISKSLAVDFKTLSQKTVAEKIGDQIEQSAQEKIKGFKIENQDDIARLTKEIEDIINQASSKVAPPRITGAEPKAEVSSSFAAISWVTDRPANSIVAYASLNDYAPGAEEPYKVFIGNADEQVTEHKVILSDLAPGALYHYQVRSKGLIGGVGKSADYTFKTTEEGSIAGVEIKEITKDSAVIFWRTNIPATTLLNYGLSTSYGLSQADPSYNASHTAILRNLQPGTFYHFKIGGTDKNNNGIASPDLTFTTESLPSLLNVKIDEVKEKEMRISWFTDVLADSMVEYTNVKTDKTETIGDKQLVRNHALTVTGLAEDTQYKFYVISKDDNGNEVKSSTYNLQTGRDREAPEITNVQIQSAVSGRDRVQTIVSWKTSELASSRVTYQEGVVRKPELEKSSPLDNDLKTNHIVVFTDFQPGAVYRLKIESVDAASNAGESRDLTILTPQRKETVVDLIIKNLQDIFRWTEKMR